MPQGAKANLSLSRGSEEEEGENLNFRIWTELKDAREERARDRDADRILGLEHVQLAIEGAPRGAIVRVRDKGRHNS